MERNLVKRGLTRIILLPIILSVFYAVVLVWQLYRMLDAGDWVQHSSQEMILSNEALRHIQFQESALRGYDIAPNSMFIKQFHREEIKVDSVFEILHVQTIDNPAQTRRLDSLMQLYWTWQSSAHHSLAAATALNTFAPGPLPPGEDSNVVYRAMLADTLRAGFGRLIGEERRLYAVRTERFKEGTALLLVFIAIASIGLGGIVGLYARRQAKRFVNRFSEAIDETKQNRDLLETTLLSIDDAVIVTAPDGKVTMMNARAQKLCGWDWPEAKGRLIDTVFLVVSEDKRVEIENPSAAVLRDKNAIRLKEPIVLISRTGVEYPIEQTAAPVYNSRREIAAVVIVFRDISELRENEREAKEREREFRALIENSPDIIIRYARDLTITYANSAVEQALSMSPAALIGRRLRDLGLPDDMSVSRERAILQVFQNGVGMSDEVQYRTNRGIRTYHFRLVPEGLQEDESKKLDVQNVISIGRDVTEMKQAERRLRESEQRFRGIADNSPDAFFLLRAVRELRKNGNGTVTDFSFEYMNSKAADLLTLPISEVKGRRVTDVLPGERPRHFIEEYARILETGVASSQEYTVETPYVKEARWLHSQYIPLGDMLAVITSDVTARKQTTDALERSEERYRRLVEHASEAIFSTDTEGRFTYANPYVCKLGGYEREDITKYHFTDLVAPAHREIVKRHFFRQFLSRTPSSHIDAPFLRHDGGEVWLAVTTTLELQDETVEGFDCIGSDITERKQMEQELDRVKSEDRRKGA